MYVLPKPLIKFAVLYMILTLASVNVKFRKYLLSRRIVCGCTVSQTYITLIHLESNNTWVLDTTNKIINNNVTDVIKKLYFI